MTAGVQNTGRSSTVWTPKTVFGAQRHSCAQVITPPPNQLIYATPKTQLIAITSLYHLPNIMCDNTILHVLCRGDLKHCTPSHTQPPIPHYDDTTRIQGMAAKKFLPPMTTTWPRGLHLLMTKQTQLISISSVFVIVFFSLNAHLPLSISAHIIRQNILYIYLEHYHLTTCPPAQ